MKEVKKKQPKKVDVNKFIERKLNVLNAKGDSKKSQLAMARIISSNRGNA